MGEFTHLPTFPLNLVGTLEGGEGGREGKEGRGGGGGKSGGMYVCIYKDLVQHE